MSSRDASRRGVLVGLVIILLCACGGATGTPGSDATDEFGRLPDETDLPLGVPGPGGEGGARQIRCRLPDCPYERHIDLNGDGNVDNQEFATEIGGREPTLNDCYNALEVQEEADGIVFDLDLRWEVCGDKP